MRPYCNFSRTVSLFLIACLLAGCGALRIGYANGDNLAYWWMDRYVDFNADQKPWVKARIRKLLAWHRTTQLHDYAQLLAQYRRRLAGEVTPAEVQADYAVLKQRARRMIDQALPDLADLALSLEPQQIAHIEKRFSSNNDTYRKDYLRGNLEDRQQYRFKKVMKQAEYWFGDFSRAQEARIRAASDARPLDNELRLAERVRRQQALIRVLKKIRAERPGRDAVIALLREQVADIFDGAGVPQDSRIFLDASDTGTAQLVALIWNIATPSQKAHAADRAEKLIDDCHTLADNHDASSAPLLLTRPDR
jgi:hypothetical protein